MKQNMFKVSIPKEIDIGYIFCCVFLETLFILWSSYGKSVVGTVLAILFFLLIFTVELSEVLFFVKVENSTINIRTRYGRRYKFSILDIDKVICSERSSWKYGTIYYITLFIKSHEFEMEGSMNNFGKLAGYLLEKYEKGEMNDSALPDNCKRRLCHYRDGAIFNKKK